MQVPAIRGLQVCPGKHVFLQLSGRLALVCADAGAAGGYLWITHNWPELVPGLDVWYKTTPARAACTKAILKHRGTPHLA